MINAQVSLVSIIIDYLVNFFVIMLSFCL